MPIVKDTDAFGRLKLSTLTDEQKGKPILYYDDPEFDGKYSAVIFCYEEDVPDVIKDKLMKDFDSCPEHILEYLNPEWYYDRGPSYCQFGYDLEDGKYVRWLNMFREGYEDVYESMLSKNNLKEVLNEDCKGEDTESEDEDTVEEEDVVEDLVETIKLL
jgi:hypothetical protein